MGPKGDVEDLNLVKEIIKTAETHQVGWIAWAWYPFPDNNFFSRWAPEAGKYEITPYGEIIKKHLVKWGR